LWLRSDRFNRTSPLGITWPDKPLKILGVYLSYDSDSAEQLNFGDKIKKCKTIISSWKSRNLTFFGRNQIIKTFIVSQFLYTGAAIEFPDKYVKEINYIIFDFIWNGKKPKLKREILLKRYELGGINVPDFSIMLKTSSVKWVKKYDNGQEHSWKYMLKYFSLKSNIKINWFLKSNYNIKDTNLLRNMPKFYLNMLDVWQTLGDVEGGRNSIIWYNTNFKINGKIIMMDDFLNNDIIHVFDLFDVDGEPLSFNSIIQKGVAPQRWLAWHSLLTCVLRKKDIVLKYKNFVHELSRLCIGTSILCEVTSRQIYSLLHEDKYGIEVCKPRISKYLTEDIEWSLYFTNLQYIQDTKSREFQFKFLHDIHVNKYWLYKWGIKDSDICDYCNIHKEDISHMFWECQNMHAFMSKFIDIILLCFNQNIIFSWQQ